ncbi:hypothetical protein OUZ56_001514 [Daphnia magna]|uniref:Uncharacterized protein n=1 Tax=Daphnia magna TaxID=35525 RepID=A0ABR0A2W9_9CRUS|nr:hypothetical protein OUZ56_001514 [Daphnia magna]
MVIFKQTLEPKILRAALASYRWCSSEDQVRSSLPFSEGENRGIKRRAGSQTNRGNEKDAASRPTG